MISLRILNLLLPVGLLLSGLTAAAQPVAPAVPAAWRGQIVDRQTNEPLPFVTILVASRRSGTVANANGQYAFNLPNATATDTVAFSSVGYETYRVVATELANSDALVRLKRAVATLPEATVRSVNAEELVRQAIRRVGQNYPNRPVLMQGFYREWVREKAYLVFAEGSLELYKASYKSNHSDEVRLLKGRRKALAPYVLVGSDTCYLPPITNGPHMGILLDVVKGNNGSNSFLTPKRLPDYTFDYDGLTILDGNDVFSIRFEARPGVSTAFFNGQLLIDRASKAIVRADYVLSLHGMAVVNGSLERSRLPLRLVARRYVVNYRKQGDRWYLQHAYATNEYEYTARQLAPIRARMDFVATNTSDVHVHRFAKKEILRMDQTFAEEVRAFDDSFWQNQTIIVDDQP